MMFVSFAIEGFAEVERLFPCTELDFHGPAGAVERGELTYVGLSFTQIGQYEVPAVAAVDIFTIAFKVFF